ncbi:MAG: hypothetical protein KKD69_09305 [Euryarchaeota archaeon]|nr:hypothetical protein [Euryarchaeota archaeon]MCG2728489.1 hypothetical protein [Candidatus Methanoperedenaceae archaeon]
MDRVIVMDADMASAFAKINRLEEYQKLLIEKRTLGKGELEAISICRHRGYIFSSLDAAALRFAEEGGVKTLQLHSILRSLWESGLLSKDEVKAIIKEIEERDNTQIKNAAAVFRRI